MNELTGALPAHLMERPPEVQDRSAMGKDDFMKLLMAQLKNQDPLNPMDHKEFSTQLAQFASLEKLTQIGAGIGKLEGGMGEEAKLQALGMIGKRIQAGGAEVNLIENQPTELRLNTDNGFRPAKVSIFGGDGRLVREIEPDPTKDTKSITWDGRGKDGEAMPTGKYYFRVAGVGPDGKGKEMESSLTGKVIGVEMVDKTPMILIDTGTGQTKVELTKVTSVATDEPEKKPAAKGKPGTAPSAPAAANAKPNEASPKQEAAPEAAPTETPQDARWPNTGFADAGRGWMEFQR